MCFLFKQQAADDVRISDWSSDVCSSDLRRARPGADAEEVKPHPTRMERDGGAVDACAAHRRHRTATQCVRRNRADHRAVVTKMREADGSEERSVGNACAS